MIKHIQLLPPQIATHWDLIKFAVNKVSAVEKKHMQTYMNKLLNDLLSSRAQCFVRIEDKTIIAIILTRVADDPYRNVRTLFIDAVFSYRAVEDSEWYPYMDLIKKYAEVSNCSVICTYSSVPRVWELCKKYGFTESFRCFTIDC